MRTARVPAGGSCGDGGEVERVRGGVRRGGDAGGGREGAVDVGEAHHLVAPCPRLQRFAAVTLGRAVDQRHMGGGLQVRGLGPHVVVTEHLAVVGGEDDVRGVEEVELPQPRQQHPHRVVDLGDQRVIRPSDEPDHLRVESVRAIEDPGGPHEAGVDRGGVGGPVATNRVRHRAVLIHQEVRQRRVERRVGLREADVEEERPGGVAGFEKVDGPVDDPMGEGVGFVDGGEAGLHLVLTQPVGHGPAEVGVAGHVPVVVLEDLGVLVAVVAAGGVVVELSETGRLVARAGEDGREGEVGAVGGGLAEVAVAGGHAVVMLAGEERGAGGGTHGGIRVAAGEVDPGFDEKVEVGGEHVGGTRSRDGVEALLVGGDEQEVGPLGGSGHGRESIAPPVGRGTVAAP